MPVPVLKMKNGQSRPKIKKRNRSKNAYGKNTKKKVTNLLANGQNLIYDINGTSWQKNYENQTVGSASLGHAIFDTYHK